MAARGALPRGLLAQDLERGSLYDLLADRYDTHIAWTRESLEPSLLRTREAGLLQRPRRAPVLLIEGVAFDEADLPVEFGRTYVRGDRTRYFVERTVRAGSVAHDHAAAPAAGRGQEAGTGVG